MADFLSKKQRKLQVGITSSTEGTRVLDVIGDSNFTGIITAQNFSGDGSTLTGIVTAINAGEGISIDQTTGSVTITATGSAVADAVSYWSQTSSGIHTLSNVGIGTTNPTSELTVSGNALFTGIVTAQDFYYNNESISQLINTKIDGIGIKSDGVGIGTFNVLNFVGTGVSIVSSGTTANISFQPVITNIDGGVPNSVYGGIPIIDGGGI